MKLDAFLNDGGSASREPIGSDASILEAARNLVEAFKLRPLNIVTAPASAMVLLESILSAVQSIERRLSALERSKDGG